jgi:hypothetical protein
VPKAFQKEHAVAKKQQTKDRSPNPGVAALQQALPDDVNVLPVALGTTVTVDVDVNEMTIPYTVATDAHVVIKSLVDRREDLPDLDEGTHRLSWGFAHATKGWKHKISVNIGGKTTVLEERSEGNKDPDHSIGVAFLVVS